MIAVLVLVGLAAAAPDACFPLTTTLIDGTVRGLLVEPVFLEEWSRCEGRGINDITTWSPLLPSDGASTQELVRSMVDDYNGRSASGIDYTVKQADDGWLIVPVDEPPLVEIPVHVTPTNGPTLGSAERAVMDVFAGERGIMVAHPMPSPHLELPNTVSMAAAPAWQALRNIHRAHEAVPMGWMLRVYPDHDYAQLHMLPVERLAEPPRLDAKPYLSE